MTWYGDELIENSEWVINKAKEELAGLAAAATAATAAEASAAAAATAAAGTAEAAAAAATAATAASVAAAAKAAVAAGAAAVAGMMAGQLIGWTGDKIFEGGRWAWNKLFSYSAAPSPIGDRAAVDRATEGVLAAVYASYAGTTPAWASISATYRTSRNAKIGYEFAAANVQTLMHMAQALAYFSKDDSDPRISEIATTVLPRDLIQIAHTRAQLARVLEAERNIFPKLSVSLHDHEAFLEDVRVRGAAALPALEETVADITWKQVGIQRPAGLLDDVAAWVNRVGGTVSVERYQVASDYTLRLAEYLRTSVAVWQRLSEVPWQTLIKGTPSVSAGLIDTALGNLRLNVGNIDGKSATTVREAASVSGTNIGDFLSRTPLLVNVADLRRSLVTTMPAKASPAALVAATTSPVAAVGIGHSTGAEPGAGAEIVEALALLLRGIARAVNADASASVRPEAAMFKGIPDATHDANGSTKNGHLATTSSFEMPTDLEA